jgi:hypothetical protein
MESQMGDKRIEMTVVFDCKTCSDWVSTVAKEGHKVNSGTVPVQVLEENKYLTAPWVLVIAMYGAFSTSSHSSTC